MEEEKKYIVSLLGQVSAMYRMGVKPRGNSPHLAHSLSKLMQPRGRMRYALDDESLNFLLVNLLDSSASPQVVRFIILMIAEITASPMPKAEESGSSRTKEGRGQDRRGNRPNRLASVSCVG
ncbi:unnamed protein product, partial [Discosporangium mesarthrocarpum]